MKTFRILPLFIFALTPSLTICNNNESIETLLGLSLMSGLLATPFIINNLTTPSPKEAQKCLRMQAERYQKATASKMDKTEAQKNFDYESYGCDKGVMRRLFSFNFAPFSYNSYNRKINEIERHHEILKYLQEDDSITGS